MATKSNGVTVLDRIIGYFDPRAGARRLASRNAMNYLKARGYDGASKGRRTKGWRAGSEDASAAVAAGGATLRNRSRDLIRNSPYARKGVQALSTNVIGTGIMSRLDDAKLNLRWQEWCNSRECDWLGLHNFYGLQSLVFDTVLESGEALIYRHRGAGESHTRIEVLEPDFLDSGKIQDNVKDGIQYAKDGQIEGYWLFKEHPGARPKNWKSLGKKWESFFVSKSEIKHIFKQDRPGQNRGVPLLTPVIISLRDMDDYDEAQIVRQKIAACFVGFLYDTEHNTIQVASSAEEKPMSERFEPGIWEQLPPGKDIKFGTPPGVGNDYDFFIRRNLQKVAAGLGISYEELTGDLSQVNFSSGRMGWISFHRNIEKWRWITFIPQFCEGMLEWWLEGEFVGSVAKRKAVKVTWTPPRREMIDPVKEVEAMKSSIRSGLSSLSDSVRQLGLDPEEHFAEVEKDFKMLSEKGLTLDSDPRNDIQSNSQGSEPQN